MTDVSALRKKSRKQARRANQKVAPVASDARDTVVRAAGSSYDWAAPKVEATKDWAAPHVETAAQKVKDDVIPKVAEVVAAALVASEPAREEAKTRGTAALAALRGELDPPPSKRRRRTKRFFLFLTVSGAAFAGWKVWSSKNQSDRPEPWVTPAPEPVASPVVPPAAEEETAEKPDAE